MPGPDHEQEFLEGLRTIGADGTKKPPPITAQDPTEEIETVDVTRETGTVGAPVLVSTVTLNNIFRHPDAHPVVLDLLLLHRYGPEWMEWEPETLEHIIPIDFKTSSLSEVNFSKINAIKAMHLVDTYWERWEVFLPCTMSLNGVVPDFVTMQVPSVAQCLVSIDIANRVRTDVSWSPEIKGFLEAVYHHDDIFLAVPPGDFIQVATEGLPFNVAELIHLWTDVRASGKAPADDTIVSEQLRRLLLVTNFLEESRLHLRQQLPLVSHVQA